jgi:excisionase family DNA binding protein
MYSIQRRSGDDRRKRPDRRNGVDRRNQSKAAFPSNDSLLNTQDACTYLQISRPTYLKYISEGRIKAQKVGRGWKVFKSELDRFLRAE